MKGRLTWTDPAGGWGIKGVDLGQLPPALYAAMHKLKDYEDAGVQPEDLSKLINCLSWAVEDLASVGNCKLCASWSNILGRCEKSPDDIDLVGRACFDWHCQDMLEGLLGPYSAEVVTDG